MLETQHNQEQVRHLVLDFDDFDTEEVLRNYNKIVEKENRTENSSKHSWIIRYTNRDINRDANKEGRSPKQPQRIKDLL